jgi:hypothetical protein
MPTVMMLGEDNTITHIINAGNNNDILYRQTAYRSVEKLQYLQKTVTNTQLGRQQLGWQRNFCLLGRRKCKYLAHKNTYPCHILFLIEFDTIAVWFSVIVSFPQHQYLRHRHRNS